MRLLLCNPKTFVRSYRFVLCLQLSRQTTVRLFRCTNLHNLCGNRRHPAASHVARWLCFARLMSPSLCKQSLQVWSHACALPTKFDLYNSELMLCLCNVCDNHAYAFKPPVFKYCIGQDWLKDCNPPLFVSLPRSFLSLGSDVNGVQRKASPDFTYIIFRKWEME